MSQLVIPNIDPITLDHLQAQASQHGRTVEEEARTILANAAQERSSETWKAVESIRRRLAATGREFGDSAELLREDRDR